MLALDSYLTVRKTGIYYYINIIAVIDRTTERTSGQ